MYAEGKPTLIYLLMPGTLNRGVLLKMFKMFPLEDGHLVIDSASPVLK
jgi:hypothetical protein